MIDFTPFFDAPLAIQIHATSALECLVIGVYLLIARKGGPAHKVIGYIWVTNMAVAIISSMFINELRMVGPFSFIHLLSIWGAYSLVRAIQFARARDFKAHRSTMRGLYFGGVVVAGVLSFMPGRVSNRMLFSSIGENTGFALVLGLAAVGFVVYRFRGQILGRLRAA